MKRKFLENNKKGNGLRFYPINNTTKAKMQESKSKALHFKKKKKTASFTQERTSAKKKK
jgi:hypothetical protein